MTNLSRTFGSFRNCISFAVLLEEGFLEGALQSELAIPSFVEPFKAAILIKSYQGGLCFYRIDFIVIPSYIERPWSY